MPADSRPQCVTVGLIAHHGVREDSTVRNTNSHSGGIMESVQSEPPRKFAELAKCGHALCICTVEAGEQYCSDYCASQANAEKAAADEECTCGHPECTAAHAAHLAVPGREVS